MALNPALQKMLAGAANKYKGGGNKAAKPKEGRNTYRILVNPKAVGQFWADCAVHWIKAEENGKPLAVVGDCDVVYQQPSVINAAIEMAVNSAHDEESKKLYEGWKSRKTVILPVIIRPAVDEPALLELTGTTFGKVVDLMNLYAESDVDITDPVTGLDIVITRTGVGLNTEYDVAVAPGAAKPIPNAVWERLPDPLAYIEREFFRGEEQKALNAIAQIAGIAVPRLGAPTVATPTAALTSAAATVADAAVTVVEPIVQTTVAPTVDLAAARREELKRKQAEMEAELAAMEAADAVEVPKTPVKPAENGTSVLDTSEQDAILAELDSLK